MYECLLNLEYPDQFNLGYSLYERNTGDTNIKSKSLVGTILHESLHNIGMINGKDICEKDEHAIMKSLGEQLDY